ncbi:MAG TPA: type IX secretion system membrane protein PorP/SprF [Bacteroidales bacterium]
MIRIFLILFLTLLFKTVSAQQDEQFSQYMYNQLDYNPGSAGSKDAICLSALSRQQWVGFKGAPTTSVFSADVPVKPFKINSGIGLTILNDVLGYNNNLGLKLAYAYRMDVNNGMGKIGFGLSAGFLNNALKGATWRLPGETGTGNDPSIPQENDSGMAFDLGLGVFYKTDNLYLGLSSTHLLQPNIKYKQGATFPNVRNYYLTAGYNLAMKNPLFDLQPSVLIVTDGSSSNVDLNTVLLYNKRIWGGVSYRIKSAVIGMVGIELISGLRIGYSYDFSASDLSKYNNGSHELMVGYSFNISKEKIPHKSKSVRFL